MQQDVVDNRDEIERYERMLHKQQFPDIEFSEDAKSNGIYGVPMTRGSYFDPQHDVDEDPGAMEVNLSVGVTQGVDYHEQLAKLQELQSEFQRTKNEHSKLQVGC